MGTTPASTGDPSYASVKMLSHFEGTNGVAGPYVDSSSLGANMLNASNTTFSTSGQQFGSACISGAGGRAYCPDNAAYEIGTGDFTVEFSIISPNTVAVNICLFDYNDGQGANGWWLFSAAGGTLQFKNGSSVKIDGGAVFDTSALQRIAVCRASGTTRLFREGTQIGSDYTDSKSYPHGQLDFLADDRVNYNTWSTKADEFRFTVGVGRYTANYTVASAAFPDS